MPPSLIGVVAGWGGGGLNRNALAPAPRIPPLPRPHIVNRVENLSQPHTRREPGGGGGSRKQASPERGEWCGRSEAPKSEGEAGAVLTVNRR